MPIPLEEERQPGLPVVKRQAIGEKFYGAVVLVQQRDRQKKNENTGVMESILKADGKPRQELVVTCLTLPGTDASVGLGDDEHIPEPGELVRLILKGKAFGDWIESKNDLGRPVQVGDVVSQITDRAQVYDAHGNASGPEITDQEAVNKIPRGKSVGIYGPVQLRDPKPDSEWTVKAEEAYYQVHDRPNAETGTGGGNYQSDPYGDVPPPDDEPPF